MKYSLLIMFFMLTACSSTNHTAQSDTANIMNLIALTEAQAPKGVTGTFRLPIKAADKIKNVVYLNTQLDYRDRRSITVLIKPSVVTAINDKYGTSAETFFIDKVISVSGEAKRRRIDFYANRKRTTKYYYQTHIDVDDINQITVLN